MGQIHEQLQASCVFIIRCTVLHADEEQVKARIDERSSGEETPFLFPKLNNAQPPWLDWHWLNNVKWNPYALHSSTYNGQTP